MVTTHVTLTDQVIRDAISENAYLPKNARGHMTTEEFENRYGLAVLKSMSKGKNLLEFLFGIQSQNANSLAYSLESKAELTSFFGKASAGGAATTKILNYSNGSWKKQSDNISESKAIDIADDIRQSLIAVLSAITPTTTAVEIHDLLKANQLPENQAWLKKYLTILYPDKFMPMLNDDRISRIFVPLGLIPGHNWYESSKRFSEKAQTFSIDSVHLYHVVSHCAMQQVKQNLSALGIDPAELGDPENLLINTPEVYEDKAKKIRNEEMRDRFKDYLSTLYNWQKWPGFIEYCQNNGVVNTAKSYASSVQLIGKTLNVDVDKEYRTDKCAALINKIPSAFPDSSKDYIAKLRKYVNYMDHLDTLVSTEEKKKERLRDYAKILTSSYNVIFRGAPGTGKSYLAKSIAAYMVSKGEKDHYESLADDEKERIGFVQFHPSYDYSDFVEGLRPVKTASNEIVFDRKDGIFKEFVEQAKKNYINSTKDIATVEKELSLKELVETFLEEAVDNATEFTTARGNKFTIPAYNDIGIDINIPNNPTIKDLTISMDELCKMLESTDTFNAPKDVKTFFKKKYNTQGHSYLCVLWKEITAFKKGGKFVSTTAVTEKEPLHNYVFIIDEINRGEISKILGELFFSIDPGYRGEEGSVFTQYSNMHADENEKFYIPKNVYIIGTMNDIDRSVDTFDFAMRRRFRFIEIKADEHTDMLDVLGASLKKEAVTRMKALNAAIGKTDGLNENYHVGAAYFLKLKKEDLDGNFDALWTDYLKPLLQEYVNGMAESAKEMEEFKKAYDTTVDKTASSGTGDPAPSGTGDATAPDASAAPADKDDSSAKTDED